MKSILEILAVGATIAALATASQAATTTTTTRTDPKVNVGTAAPVATGAPVCAQRSSSPSGATKGAGDAKPACATATAATGAPSNVQPAHN